MTKTIEMIKRALPEFFASADQWMAEGLAQQTDPPVSCTRGCNGCCNLMVIISLAEGLLLADHVERLPSEAQELVIDRLRATAAGLHTTARGYFTPRSQCAFLDPVSGDCRVYEIRPTTCRVHYVVSPVELCQPTKPSITEVLDKLEAERKAHALSEGLTGEVLGAPLPNLVLHCLLDPDHSKGITHPALWLEAARLQVDRD